jgi:hypothetical protein
MDWIHVLVECECFALREEQTLLLQSRLHYLHNRMADDMGRLLVVKNLLGINKETCLSRDLSIYLLGGSISAYAEDLLLMAYQLGYGGIKLCTPRFEECYYTPLV